MLGYTPLRRLGLSGEGIVNRACITDIVLYCFARVPLFGSLTTVASVFASGDHTFQFVFTSPIQDNVKPLKEDPHGFKNLCRWFAICNN